MPDLVIRVPSLLRMKLNRVASWLGVTVLPDLSLARHFACHVPDLILLVCNVLLPLQPIEFMLLRSALTRLLSHHLFVLLLDPSSCAEKCFKRLSNTGSHECALTRI